MTIVLVISIALSISALMESLVFAKLKSADKFLLSLVSYLFIILFLTIFYTGSVQKDQNRYLFSVLAFLVFLILSGFRKWNRYTIKRISLNSAVLTSAIFLIWEVAKLGFVQDKFTSGDSYSYAFGALDLNSQGDIKFSDWSKFMTSIQAFIPSLIYFTNSLQSSTSNVEINTVMTAISVTSTGMILLTFLTTIRIILIEFRNVTARIMLVTTAIIFLSSNFVFGPLSVGTALNAGISHWLILTTYFIYLLSREGLISPQFTIQISMILNILVLMNYPLLIPLSASLTLYMIFIKKENFINLTSIFLVTLFISYAFQVINSLIKHNSIGLGGSFASYEFKFYFLLFLLAGSIQLITAKFNYWILYYPFAILISFVYISLPYIKKNDFDLNYYNTKYLYLLIVPMLIILIINIYKFIEKNQNKYLFLLTVSLLFVISTMSSISNNSLILNNLQSTNMRNSLNNLANESKERLYYVNYLDQSEELLLNLWADTRNIDYSTPWEIGNKQSRGVSLIFSDWQSPPEDRICNYIKSFPNALIISTSKVDIISATKVCRFDFELR